MIFLVQQKKTILKGVMNIAMVQEESIKKGTTSRWYRRCNWHYVEVKSCSLFDILCEFQSWVKHTTHVNKKIFQVRIWNHPDPVDIYGYTYSIYSGLRNKNALFFLLILFTLFPRFPKIVMPPLTLGGSLRFFFGLSFKISRTCRFSWFLSASVP